VLEGGADVVVVDETVVVVEVEAVVVLVLLTVVVLTELVVPTEDDVPTAGPAGITRSKAIVANPKRGATSSVDCRQPLRVLHIAPPAWFIGTTKT
jgi:hypothetical protein